MFAALVHVSAAWTLITHSLPRLAGQAASVCPSNGHLYTFGGLAPSGKAVDAMWTNGGDDRWLLQPCIGRRPPKRMYAASAFLGDTMVMCGGWDPGPAGSGGVFLDDVWRFDVRTRRWRRSQVSLPDGPVSRHTMEALNATHAIVHTFRCGPGHVLLYDVLSDSIAKQPTEGAEGAAPEGLSMQAGGMIGKHFVLVGGSTRAHEMTDAVFTLDTSTWTWQRRSLPDGPCARASSSMCTFAPGESLLLFGGARLEGEYSGATGLRAQSDAWVLSVANGAFAWRKLRSPPSSSPTARVAAVLARLPRSIVLAGGWNPASHAVLDDTYHL